MQRVSKEYKAALLEAAGKASQGEWQWGHTGTETHEAAVAFFAQSVAFSDVTDLQMVLAPNGDTIAYTGNGPTSEANAQYITGCKPNIIRDLLLDLMDAYDEIRRLQVRVPMLSKPKPPEIGPPTLDKWGPE